MQQNLPLLTAVQDALHAHALLHQDVDYIVKNGVIEWWTSSKAEPRRTGAGPPVCTPQSKSKKALREKLQGRSLAPSRCSIWQRSTRKSAA